MKTPILELDHLLVASLLDELTDEGWRVLWEDLLGRAIAVRARGAVIDVRSVLVMDSFAGHMLNRIAGALRLRGVETVVVGIQPAAAFSMVQLGLHLEGVHTALDLEDAMALLERVRKPHAG